MFTGIIQAIGRIDTHEPNGGDVRLGIDCAGPRSCAHAANR